MKHIALVSAAALGLSAAAASAATIEFSDSVAIQTTDWTETISVSQFDVSLGTLTSVMVTLDGAVEGEANTESLDAAASTVTLELQAEINASTAILGAVGTVLPVVSTSQSLTAFDGTVDFGGSSGFASGVINADDQDMNTFTGADMDEFIGSGFLSILVAAEGDTDASGSGNLINQFITQAEATVTVKYTYDEAVVVPTVPLPAGALLLGTALFGLGFARRKA